MRIDRCYCYQKTFSELKKVADAQDVRTVSHLQEHVTFGENCELCHPYVRRMIRTGQTTFHQTIETGSADTSDENGDSRA